MDLHQHPLRTQLEDIVPAEWERLVRLCSHLSGSADDADDLAQETLVEAWRNADSLRESSSQRAWLSGIARNVCLRWRRRQARELDRHERLARQERLTPTAHDDLLADLERADVAGLLDRALDTLPETIRDVLVLRYLDELGNRDIADHLELSEGSVAVQLHRGRSALRRALTQPELRAEVIALGIVSSSIAGWHQTRLWCPFCGQHRIEIRIEPDTHTILCRCTGRCHHNGTIIGEKRMLERSRELSSVKSILSRELLHLHDIYQRALEKGFGTCKHCGQPAPVERWPDGDHDRWATQYSYGIQIACQRCGVADAASLWHLLIDTPEAQRFWRRHPRMRALPVREIDAGGREALVSGFISFRGEERLEIVTAQDTREVLQINGNRSG